MNFMWLFMKVAIPSYERINIRGQKGLQVFLVAQSKALNA